MNPLPHELARTIVRKLEADDEYYDLGIELIDLVGEEEMARLIQEVSQEPPLTH